MKAHFHCHVQTKHRWDPLVLSPRHTIPFHPRAVLTPPVSMLLCPQILPTHPRMGFTRQPRASWTFPERRLPILGVVALELWQDTQPVDNPPVDSEKHLLHPSLDSWPCTARFSTLHPKFNGNAPSLPCFRHVDLSTNLGSLHVTHMLAWHTDWPMA